VIFKPGKNISRHIRNQNWYTCPIALPVRRNPHHRSLFDCCLSHFRSSISTPSSPAKRLLPSYELVYATNTSHRKQETLLYEYPLHWVLFLTKKKHNRTLLFCSILLKHGRHFDYWHQPLNMRMRVCNLDCHEAELCCYLVIHIENLSHQLQLFYLHLWPVYWFSLVHTSSLSWMLYDLPISPS
jgi:hypothetical protein